MADELKTVGGEPVDNSEFDSGLVDPLLREQTEQATQMRDALLTCRKNDITSAKVALQNIAVLQVYHQVARIIRFIEMMDRLEDKLYASIAANLAQMDEFDPATMLMLTKVQADMMKTMAISKDVLQPFTDLDLDAIAPPVSVDDEDSFGAAILPKESRNAIRNGAQALLTELTKTNTENRSDGEDNNDGTADTQ